MKSIPASSAMRASRRQSGQLADQRSGTLVAARPDEQFAPKMPIFSALALYMAMRSRIDPVRADKALSVRAIGEGRRAHEASASPVGDKGATSRRPGGTLSLVPCADWTTLSQVVRAEG